MIFFQFPKHIMRLSLQKNTTHVPEIQNYELSGFVYVMLDDGGNSSWWNEIKCWGWSVTNKVQNRKAGYACFYSPA